MARKALITQRERAFAFLKARGMARLSELIGEGVTASTVSRLEREGAIIRLARGLYQLPDASIDAQHTLAEVAKLVPNLNQPRTIRWVNENLRKRGEK